MQIMLQLTDGAADVACWSGWETLPYKLPVNFVLSKN
jgi:hypothetical protein